MLDDFVKVMEAARPALKLENAEKIAQTAILGQKSTTRREEDTEDCGRTSHLSILADGLRGD